MDEGETAWEGRVELCMNGRWRTVGGNEWNPINSRVVCNSLGYEFTSKLRRYIAKILLSNACMITVYNVDGPADKAIPMAPSKPLYLHDIQCSEGNLALLECRFTKSSNYEAVTNDKHAVVKCQERKWYIFHCDQKYVLIVQLNVKMET